MVQGGKKELMMEITAGDQEKILGSRIHSRSCRNLKLSWLKLLHTDSKSEFRMLKTVL